VAFGCEVYVISRNKNKEALAKKMGAKAIIPSGDEEELKQAAGGFGLVDASVLLAVSLPVATQRSSQERSSRNMQQVRFGWSLQVSAGHAS
jgi:D-arabinose 1-dehydrogenase-like Zn-dependent alcohol dehydrogenase